MKLVHLLDVISSTTVIWVAQACESINGGGYLGPAGDAEKAIPNEYLFGDVTAVFGEMYRPETKEKAAITIIVDPYKGQ